MIIATAGHVDHGKTALIKRLTGVDTDRLAEEKARGLSIDIGFAYLPLRDDSEVLGFVDVPGHERFISNMLAGVGAIDYAMLIVAADDGIMPQTEEHLAILDLLKIPAGVVVVTKIDRVPPQRVAEVRAQVVERLRGTSLEGATVIGVSSVTGEGIDALQSHLRIARKRVSSGRAGGNFRLAIDRRFTVAGAGLVVTGAVFSGSVAVGDHLVLSPRGLPVRVRGLHAQNRPAQSGGAGQRLALNLVAQGLEKDLVRRGDWLVAPPAHCPTSRIDARVRVLPSSAPLLHGRHVHLHLGAADLPARVAVLGARSIDPGGNALVQLVLDRPLSAVRGDRFVLRDPSCQRTVGGGAVIDPFGPARGRAREARIRQLEALEHASPQDALEALLALEEGVLDLTWFARAANLTAAEANSLRSKSDFLRVGTSPRVLGVTRDRWLRLRAQALERVDEAHRLQPQALGPTETTIRTMIEPRVDPLILGAVLADLVKSGELGMQGQSYFLPRHRGTFRDAKDDLGARVRALLAGSGVPPATVIEMAAQLRVSQRHVVACLNRAATKGLVHRVTENRYYLPETLVRLAREAEAVSIARKDGWFRVTDFRDRTGIGRNPSIEVLEFFDRTGLTRRTGDDRQIVRGAVETFATGKVFYRR